MAPTPARVVRLFSILLILAGAAGTGEAGQQGVDRTAPGPRDIFEPTAAPAAVAADGRAGFSVMVRFDRLRQAADAGGTLNLSLTGDLDIRAAIRRAQSDGPQTFLAGPLLDNHQGEMSLTVVGDTLAGRIVVDGRLFMVRRAAGSVVHVITEADPQSLRPEAPPRVPAASAFDDTRAESAGTDTNAFVDLMVLYTPASRAALGGTPAMVAELTAAVNNANLALANANVTHRFRLVYSGEIAYVETNDLSTSLDRLTNLADGYMDNVLALRNLHHADEVSLITTDADACGIGWIMSNVSASFESLAYNVVAWDCANANLSLAHEIGHNMGLQHDRANAGSVPAFPYAYGYAVPGVARDVMAYPCTGPACPRVAIFSTPLANFPGFGVAAGTATEDTARALNNTSLTIANFRQSVTCTYTLTSTSATVGPAGGAGSVGVTAPAGCTWAGTSNSPSFLTVTSGASGSGNGTVGYFVSSNSGAMRNGTLTIAGQPFTLTQATADAASGDFDGDRKSDMAVYRPSSGTWYLLKSSTDFATWTIFQWGLSTDTPVPGDYDGDGKTDMAVYRPSNGTWYLLKSSTNFATWIVFQWGIGGDVPVAGDYDGDGISDMAVYRPSNGTWYLLKSSTNFASWTVYQWGIGGDVPVPGDYDGDGKTDMAVYRPSNGTWYLLKSSTNFATWTIFQWGFSTDTPVPGDYDGDGKTDMAVYRPSNGNWYLLKSSTNFATWTIYQWGLSTDTPVPGDYDGDGKTDMAVYRPTTGYWYLLKSSTSFTTWTVYQWGTPGDIPVFQTQ